jgi:uncharacterized protein YdaU (DUF1376 family)
MKGEFYKMEFDAWDEGTVELTLDEEAAYLRLCHQMYRRRGPIPNSDRLLCSLWRCHQNKARPLLQRLIAKGKIRITEDGALTNQRVGRELDDRETLRTHRAHAGHTGGIRSGHARRKPLETKGVDEAKRSRGEEIREEKKEPPNPLKGANGCRRHPWPDDWREQLWTAYGKAVEKKPSMAAAEALWRADKTAWADLIGGVNRQSIAVPDPTFRPALHRFIKNEKWTDNYATGPPRPQQSRWAI